MLLEAGGGGTYRHILQNCNMIAHTLATVGSRSLGCLVGDGNVFPLEIIDVLLVDLI